MQDPAPATDTLATADFAGLFQSVGGPLLGLIVVVVIGWFGIVRIRRWMKGEAESNEPFTLNDLRTQSGRPPLRVLTCDVERRGDLEEVALGVDVWIDRWPHMAHDHL